MVKVVLIRHGEKLYESNHKYYDSPIRRSELYRGERLFQKYILDNDIQPTRIISSPYLRTRETAAIVSRITALDVEVDERFSNYIGPRKDYSEESFHDSTLQYNPAKPETKEEFHKRIRESYQSLVDNASEDDIIWVITHRFAISSCVTMINPKLRCSFRPMSGAIIEGNNITWLNDE